ncbi:hypothetical protein GCM10009625_21350 [Brachybacterium fresconis]|uniref:Mutator family transposase n=1 Tax=Brachybacterium fresconis TaxID=173363 RepID=A0ABS4YNB5_9MICO|nr:transposase-like protein [Brachybacterium fresconis]
MAEALPLLYLHGLSSSDFAPALEQFLGSAAGLSSATITRLTGQWQDEAAAFNTRSLADTDYVYVYVFVSVSVWVDGIHLTVRLNQDKICLLVMIGVRADGAKELIALDDGHRESAESWADLLRDCKRRRMAAPALAIGDGALGFWSALRDVFPATREQRCWFHKIANVLNALPKSAQPGAKKALAEIRQAEDRTHAEAAARAFADEYGVKRPKAAAKVTDDLHVLLEFYDYPAEHWIHPRTTNPIESTFATIRLRQRVTKGPGSRAAGIAMAFKLIESAPTWWRRERTPPGRTRPRRSAIRERPTRRTPRRPDRPRIRGATTCRPRRGRTRVPAYPTAAWAAFREREGVFEASDGSPARPAPSSHHGEDATVEFPPRVPLDPAER